MTRLYCAQMVARLPTPVLAGPRSRWVRFLSDPVLSGSHSRRAPVLVDAVLAGCRSRQAARQTSRGSTSRTHSTEPLDWLLSRPIH